MFKVMIDAGHGGQDPGAIGINNLLEKDMNLQVVKKLKAIHNHPEITLYYTRITDGELGLMHRVKMSDNNGMDLYFSVHHNAGGGVGFETIYNDGSSKGLRFAKLLAGEYIKLGRPPHNGGIVARDDLYIRHTKAPSIISEFCFIDNEDVRSFDAEKEAKAIYAATLSYFGLSSLPYPNIERWKIDGAEWLFGKGLTKELHQGNEPLDIGTLGTILKNWRAT